MSSPAASARTVTHFNLTGFGEFQGVASNPTEQLMHTFADTIKEKPLPANVCLDSCTVLETSGVGSRETFRTLRHCCDPEPAPADGAGSHQESEVKHRRVWIHFGVHAGSEQFALESTGYNNADFRVPDQRGWQPSKETILEGMPEEMRSTLDLPALAAQLAACPASGGGELCQTSPQWRVCVSTDPGRFVCNFIFFHSLARCKDDADAHSLFVHVPQHAQYSLQAQQAFARELIVAIAESLEQQDAKQNGGEAQQGLQQAQ